MLIKRMKQNIFLLLFAVLLLSGCNTQAQDAADPPQAETQDATQPAVADESQMAPVQDVVDENMTPIQGSALRDGTYEITVDSSSSMFEITACELTAENGQLSAVMHMGGTGYLYVFMGTGEQAAAADEMQYIPFEEEPDGTHTYTVPVEALDQGIACAAFSKRKQLWYDRTLVFRADSLPLEAFAEGAFTTVESLGLADGSYTADVRLEGGSGRASVESPAALRVEGGNAYAVIVWGSSNYDYMRIGETQFAPIPGNENSTFEIPVQAFDRALTVCADTTAMSTPHEIEYTLFFDSASLTPAA